MPDAENSSLEEMFVKLCKDKEMHEMVNTEPYLTSKYSLTRWCGGLYINIMQKVLESSLTVKNWNEMFKAAQNKTEKMKTVETIE